MTIEIHNPEIERIVNEAVLSGQFPSAGDVLSEAVLTWSNLRRMPAAAPSDTPQQTLLEFFRASPLVGLELDIKRRQDAGRDTVL